MVHPVCDSRMPRNTSRKVKRRCKMSQEWRGLRQAWDTWRDATESYANSLICKNIQSGLPVLLFGSSSIKFLIQLATRSTFNLLLYWRNNQFGHAYLILVLTRLFPPLNYMYSQSFVPGEIRSGFEPFAIVGCGLAGERTRLSHTARLNV